MIPDTGVSLVYLSSRTHSYQSVITVLLISGEVPITLQNVALQIFIQGVWFEKKFEAISNLQYTFIWNQKDAYGQDVYGKVKAKGTELKLLF